MYTLYNSKVFGLYHQENYIFLVLKKLSTGFSYKGQNKQTNKQTKKPENINLNRKPISFPTLPGAVTQVNILVCICVCVCVCVCMCVCM